MLRVKKDGELARDNNHGVPRRGYWEYPWGTNSDWVILLQNKTGFQVKTSSN
jgi:hypothetical protein